MLASKIIFFDLFRRFSRKSTALVAASPLAADVVPAGMPELDSATQDALLAKGFLLETIALLQRTKHCWSSEVAAQIPAQEVAIMNSPLWRSVAQCALALPFYDIGLISYKARQDELHVYADILCWAHRRYPRLLHFMQQPDGVITCSVDVFSAKAVGRNRQQYVFTECNAVLKDLLARLASDWGTC